MNIDVECLPCFIRMAVEASQRGRADSETQWRVVREVVRLLASVSADECPPQFTERVFDAVSALLHNHDLFADVKAEGNALARELVPGFRRLIHATDDPLLATIKLAIAGNSMDFGIVSAYGDVAAFAGSALAADFGIDDYSVLRSMLERATNVLVLGDNCGEAVFDRALIEEMRRVRDCEYTYMVRGRPIINDVTLSDAVSIGLDRVATLIESGCGAPGFVPSECTAEARERFLSADLVISKGQGNYEALSEAPRDVFFLLLVKCSVVSRHLGAPVGAAVLKHHRAS